MLLCACSGGLRNTEWKASGSVDELGNEVNAVKVNGAFGTLSISFFVGNSGSLHMQGTSYTFTYANAKDGVALTMVDGSKLNASIKKDKLYLTIGESVIVFTKK
jgi:hypothetical protein